MFSEQCLLPGLHGYLIRFAFLAFILHCQICTCKVPSPIVSLPKINTFNRYLGHTPYILPVSSLSVSLARSILETWNFTRDLINKLRMF